MFIIDSVERFFIPYRDRRMIEFFIDFKIKDALFESHLVYRLTRGWGLDSIYKANDAICPFCRKNCSTDDCEFLNEHFSSITEQIVFLPDVLSFLQSEENPFRLKMALRGALLK